MTLHQPEELQFTVSAQRHEVMFKDGTAITLYPVFEAGAPRAHHRAICLPKGVTLVIDLRRLVHQIGEDICLAAPKDVPGIVFYTLRHRFSTSELFVRAVIEHGAVLRQDARLAA